MSFRYVVGEKYAKCARLHLKIKSALVRRDNHAGLASIRELQKYTFEANELLNSTFMDVDSVEELKHEIEMFICGNIGDQDAEEPIMCVDKLIEQYECELEAAVEAQKSMVRKQTRMDILASFDDVDDSELECERLKELTKWLVDLKHAALSGLAAQLAGAEASYKMRVLILRANYQKVEDLIEEAGIQAKVAVEELPTSEKFTTFRTLKLFKKIRKILEDMYNGEIKLNVRTKRQETPC